MLLSVQYSIAVVHDCLDDPVVRIVAMLLYLIAVVHGCLDEHLDVHSFGCVSAQLSPLISSPS